MKKRHTGKRTAALLLVLAILVGTIPEQTLAFSVVETSLDTGSESLSTEAAADQNAFPSESNSGKSAAITNENEPSEAELTSLQMRTIYASGNEGDANYDISVSGNLPADATLQVCVVPAEMAQKIVDSVPKEVAVADTNPEKADLAISMAEKGLLDEDAAQEIVEEACEGRIASGLMDGASEAFLYDISIISEGKKYQPEEHGEEVIVTFRNVSADNIYHIKTDVTDSNGELDEAALASVSEKIAAGRIETENLPFIAEGDTLSFALDSFSLAGGETFDTNLYWEITDDKKLIIRPKDGYTEGTLRNQTSGTSADGAGSKWPWYSFREDIESVEIKETVKAQNEIRGMFANCYNLTSVDLSGMEANSVIVLNDMFNGCSALTSVDLGTLKRKPNGLQQTNRMFWGCTNLKTISFDGFNLSDLFSSAISGNTDFLKNINIQTISMKNATLGPNAAQYFFKNRASLQKIDLTGSTFNNNVSNVSYINGMFNGTDLQELSLSGVTFTNSSLSLSGLFTGATGIKELDLSNLTIPQSRNLNISSLMSLEYLNASGSDITLASGTGFPNTGNAEWDFIAGGTVEKGITSAQINSRITSAGNKLPAGIYRLTVTEGLIDEGNIDGQVKWELAEDGTLTIKPYGGNSGILSMNEEDWLNFGRAGDPKGKVASTKFYSASDWPWNVYSNLITNVVVEGTITTGDYVECNEMFKNCENLTDVDLSGWDASKVISLSGMFDGCTSLTSFDADTFGTAPGNCLENISEMFHNCAALSDISLDGLNLSSVNQAQNVFTNSAVENVSARGATLGQTAASNLFQNVSTIKNIDLSNASISAGTGDISSMLEGTSSLENLNISGLTNPRSALLVFDNVPIGASITSDGTTYVEFPVTGEWSVNKNGAIVSGKLAEDLRKDYIDSNKKLTEGIYTKTGEGVLSVYGEMGDIVWEIVDNGVLKIYPKNGVSGTLVCPTWEDSGRYWPWDKYRELITSVEMNQGTVLTNNGAELCHMFRDCTRLKTVDLSSFDASKVVVLNDMFSGCSSLDNISLNFKNGSDAKVTQINRIFQNCISLKTVDFCGLGTNGSLQNYNFVSGCTNLETLDLSGVEFGDGATVSVSGCNKLKEIILAPANGDKALTIVLPEGNDNAGNSLGTWKLAETKYSGTANLPADTNGTLVKVSNSPPGLDEIGSTYYVIDKLEAYEIQIWDASKENADGTTGGYRVISNYSIVDGNIVVDNANLPSNDETWMDTDDTSYHIRNSEGHIEIYTVSQSGQDWKTGAESGTTATTNAMGEKGYKYDMKPNGPDIIITYKNAAMDVNGDRHDVVMNIDKFTFYNTDKHQTKTSYRRAVLGVGDMRTTRSDPSLRANRVAFRDYIVQTKDEKEGGLHGWRLGTDESGTGNLGSATYASGTWTDAAFKIADGTANQTVLFFVGDLDIARNNSGAYGPGSEGIILGEGFDEDTIAIADNTKLATYDYVYDNETGNWSYEPHTGDGQGRYIVGTEGDGDTYRSRFYAIAAADGAAFTWTSGLNCDTNFLETNSAIDVWRGLPPVVMQPFAKKKLDGDTLKEGQFEFEILPDDSYSLADGNLAQNPLAPYHDGGIGTVAANGTVTFPKLSFEMSSDRTYNPIGTHYYILKEKKGTASDIEYDETTHKLRIEIEGVETDVAAGTVGYTLKAYIGSKAEPIITTYSSSTVTYADAVEAASGATSAEFLGKTYRWTDGATNYTYAYDQNEGVWKRNDGQIGNPPADAVADYELSYMQAQKMAYANPEGSINNSVINATTWTGENEKYQYRTSYGPIELDYSGISQSGMSLNEIREETWTDTSVTPNVTYRWERVPTIARYASYEGAKIAKTWQDDAGNTYRYEQTKSSMTLEEAEGVHTPDSSAIRQVVWTDPTTRKKYAHPLYTNYQNDPLKNQHHTYSVSGDNGYSLGYEYAGAKVDLRRAIDNYTNTGTAEELFSGTQTPPHFYVKERVESIPAQIQLDYDATSTESGKATNNLTTADMRNKCQTNFTYYDADLGVMIRWTDIEQGKFEIIYLLNYCNQPAFVRSQLNLTDITIDGFDYYYLSGQERTARSWTSYNEVKTWNRITTGRAIVDESGVLYAGFYGTYYTAAVVVSATMNRLTTGWVNVVGQTTGKYGSPNWSSISTDPKTAYNSFTGTTWTWSGGNKLARLGIDSQNRFVYYAPYTVNGEFQYDQNSGELLFKRYYYENNINAYYKTPEDAMLAGDTMVPISGYVTLSDIYNRSGELPYIAEPYSCREYFEGNLTGKCLVVEPAEDATRWRSNNWCYYEDLPGYATQTTYASIPKTAIGLVSTGIFSWIRYDDQGNLQEQITSPPDDAWFVNGYHNAWVKYVGDSTTGEEVAEPSPRSKPSTPVEVTYANVWLVLDKANSAYKHMTAEPPPSATAMFTLTYQESAYAVSDAVNTDYIRSLSWEDGGDLYTYVNGTWKKNGSETVTAPPDTATAVFWADKQQYNDALTGVEFKNRKTVSLTVNKIVTGEGIDGTENFEFKVTFPGLEDQEVSAVVNGQTVTVLLDNGGSYAFELGNNGSVKFSGLSVGQGYEVKETLDSDFETSADVTGHKDGVDNKAGRNGSVTDASLDDHATVYYTNRLKPGKVTLRKETLNDDEGTFVFKVKFIGAYTPTKYAYNNGTTPGNYTYVYDDTTKTLAYTKAKDANNYTSYVINISVPGAPTIQTYHTVDGQLQTPQTLTVTDLTYDADTGKASFIFDGKEYSFAAVDVMGNAALTIYRNDQVNVTPTGSANTESIWQFSLSNGEEISFPDVPKGVRYEIVEDIPAGSDWILESIDGDDEALNATGTVQAARENRHVFLNKKRSADITIKKETEDDLQGVFKFRVKFKNDFEPGAFNQKHDTVTPSSYSITIDGDKVVHENRTDSENSVRYEVTATSVKYIVKTDGTEAETVIAATDIKVDTTTGRASFVANGKNYVFSDVGTDSSSLEVYQNISLTKQTGTTDNVWEFTQSNGQMTVIRGVPYGTEFEIWEELENGWELVSVNGTTKTGNGLTTGKIETEESKDYVYTFLNRSPNVSLTIGKTVTGNMGDKTKTFTFTFTATALAGRTLKDGNNNNITVSANGTYVFELGHEDTFTIHGIPKNTAYKVEETNYSGDGYTTQVDGTAGRKAEGTITDNTTHAFVNNRAGTVPTGFSTGRQFYWYGMFALAVGGAAIWMCLFFAKKRRLKKQRSDMFTDFFSDRF